MKLKIKIDKLLGVFILVVFFFSCSDDLGNYDYVDINEVYAEFEDEYVGLFGSPFEIKPKVSSTHDANEKEYTYEWYAYKTGALVGDLETDPIGTSKNLEMESLFLDPSNYEGVYRVLDNKTGVEWIYDFTLKVENALSEGWLLLNDVEGSARLDMVSKYQGEEHLVHDVLQATGSSLELEGAPVNVMTYDYEPGFYGVYITTEGNGTTKVHPSTFDWEDTYRLSYEMMGNFPTNFSADFIQHLYAGQQSLMYKDGNVYYYYRVFQYRYGTPINSIAENSFKTAPFIGYAANSIGANILYDSDNKRFVRHLSGQKSMAEMGDGDLFDYNTGMDLVYMAQTHYNDGEIFALLENPSDGKYFLARMRSDPGGVVQTFYGEIPEDITTQMKQSNFYAVSPEYGYIFYEVNGAVYEYDFSLKSSKKMIEKPGSEISVLKFDSRSSNPTQLLVGSYDVPSGEGTFEMYAVPPVNGDLEKTSSYNGFGKIKSIAYKQR